MTATFVDSQQLPDLWPTQRHEPIFWEQLGRTIATFGLLEEVLGRAIFAITATSPAPMSGEAVAVESWRKTLEWAISAPLGARIKSFHKAAVTHPLINKDALDELVSKLQNLATIRDVLCHGSWGVPDANGASIPRYFDNKLMQFESRIDAEYLKLTRAELVVQACEVMNTVTRLGYQFPGTNGPGEAIG